ncbi:MAG: hypothetical protein KBI15_00650 [Candidatus Pacebacteria bacterium]|nr:hypothetical protein [Candidatus Paceibacterota bacterium]
MKQIISLTDPKKEIIPNKKLLKPIKILVNIGLFLTALSLPLLDWRFYISGLEFNISDFLILLTAIFFLVYRLGQRFIGQAVRKWQWPLAWPMLCFLLAALLSSLFSPWRVESLKYFFRIIVFVYLLYIVLPVNALNSWRDWHWPFYGILIAGIGSGIVGLISLFSQDWSNSFFRAQPIAIFGQWWMGSNHNLLAELLIITNFFILAWGYWQKNERWRRCSQILFVSFSLITLLTFSRAAWLVVATQLLFMWLLLTKPRERFGWLLAGLLLFVLSLPLWVKMSQLQEANFGSTANHVLLTEIAWQSLQGRPIIGWGSGQFLTLVDHNLRFRAKYGDPIDSHGVLQKVVAENGYLGLIALIMVAFSLLAYWWKAWQKYGRQNLWLDFLILGASGGLLFQLFNTSYYKGKVWLPVAISLAAIKLLEHGEPKKH